MSTIKKPVHPAIIPIAHIDKLRATRSMQNTALTSEMETHPILPDEPKPEKVAIPKPKVVNVKKRVALRVLQDSITLDEDKIPPCNTCAAACCRVFIVDLHKDEYESGLYDPYVVKLDKESSLQLNSSAILVSQFMDTLLPATVTKSGDTRYMIDAQVGEPCPFLTDTNKCSIYDNRPIICRSYTCVGDSRITDEHRSGKHPMFDKFKGNT